MEINDAEDVQLSQSTTDIGVHIQLPDGGIEWMPQGVIGGGDKGSVGDIRMTDAPVVPGIVSTSIVSPLEFKITGKSSENTGEVNRAGMSLTRRKLRPHHVTKLSPSLNE